MEILRSALFVPLWLWLNVTARGVAFVMGWGWRV